MIVQCTTENVTQLIEYARLKQLVYLRIEKSNNGLVMDYSVLKDIQSEDEANRIETIMKNSIKTLLDLIGKLNQLSDILSRNVEPMSYQLVYDCMVSGNVPMFSYSSTFPNGAFDLSMKQPVNVDWNTVFADRLNEEVPDLYIKKTSKKYTLVTYEELAKMLSKQL